MFNLAIQSILHYWRLYVCIGLGVFLASAILCGSLFVGDSVRASLRRSGELRIGGIDSALIGGERLFTQAMAETSGGVPVMLMEGTVGSGDGSRRANRVQIVGVPDAFWALAPARPDLGEGRFLAVNDALSKQLASVTGDRIIARMPMPSAISKDAPLSGSTTNAAVIAGSITHILNPEEFGRFSFRAELTAPFNLFVPLSQLQDKLEIGEKANVALFSSETAGEAAEKLSANWGLADVSLHLVEAEDGRTKEIYSDRIFISGPAEAVLREVVPEAQGVLTYLVNDLSAGGKSVPYSMVAAVGPKYFEQLAGRDNKGGIVITEWLANPEYGTGPITIGDDITLTYFVVGDGREMREHTMDISAASIVSMEHPLMRRDWMPDFPGVADAETCGDWDPGFDVDDSRIRDPDEDYWDEYKGTPKAFIPLALGQSMWGNRFGRVTALRVPSTVDEATVTAGLKERMSLEEFGIALLPVAESANASVSNSLDFGALFASLSFFIVLAALVLVALLVTFAIEQRSRELGVLMALGFTRKKVRRLFLVEIALAAGDSAIFGALGGWLFTKLALWALSGMWSGAVSGYQFAFDWTWASAIGGVLGVYIMALVAAWLATRRMMQLEPKDLVAGSRELNASVDAERPVWKRASFWCVVVGLAGGGAALAAAPGLQGESLAGAFFGAGFCFLLAGLGGMALVFGRLARRARPAKSVSELGRSQAFRQTSRSLTVAAVMSAGVFLVVAVNAFRLGTVVDASKRDSGTGGFQYFAESAFPIFEDLNTDAGKEKHGLDDFKKDEFSVVAMRVLDQGEEASCLNLNAASRPRLVGVPSMALANLGAFHFAATSPDVSFDSSPWEVLSLTPSLGENVIPGIADKASAMWAMHKGIGDEIEYEDGYGNPLRVRLVAFVEGSTLQGSVLIDQNYFKEHFPDNPGFRMFFIETTEGKGEEVTAEMTRQFEDYGMEITPSLDRLARYSEVQNTYITIFSSLGGLGVLLGTIGVGLVIGRNVMERRGELAVMQAVGFRRGSIARMVVAEHWFLIVAGILLGAAAALVAVAPQAEGAGVQWLVLAGIVAAIGVAGVFFCVAAARLAVRGRLMEAIRTE